MRRELILLYVSLLLLASGGIIRADVGESGEGKMKSSPVALDLIGSTLQPLAELFIMH